jgi:hypothetical protein
VAKPPPPPQTVESSDTVLGGVCVCVEEFMLTACVSCDTSSPDAPPPPAPPHTYSSALSTNKCPRSPAESPPRAQAPPAPSVSLPRPRDVASSCICESLSICQSAVCDTVPQSSVVHTHTHTHCVYTRQYTERERERERDVRTHARTHTPYAPRSVSTAVS